MATPERNFGLDDWQYTPARLDSFIESVARGDTVVKDELTLALREGGGKAFGLKVCERVAANFAAIPYRMEVPRWEIVRDIQTFRPRSDSILRSSAETEDWLDGRSGVFRSFTASDRRSYDYLREKDELPQIPFVSQQDRSGLGLVIDIGYSTLLHRIVTRIASGNERFPDGFMPRRERGTFTSATDDAEASVGVWEAETGYPVLPTVNFGHKSLFMDNREYPNVIVKPLLNAIRKTDIDFGVQLELIVHPDRDLVFQLVQIRPTPTRIYQPILTASFTPKEQQLRERAVAKSAIVNGMFDITGEAFFFGREGLDSNFQMSNEGSTRLGSGRIGIYDWKYGDDSAYALTYDKAAGIYFGGYLAGSDVQLTPVAIRPNTHHGSMASPVSADYYDMLDQHCGMVSLRESEIDRIKAIADRSGKPLKLRIVSDGLVAQVRLIE